MKLHELAPPAGAKKNRKRIGRGPGSGTGTFAGKGCKGAKARAGRNTWVGFEGGQMPLHRRLPKRGFTPIDRKVYAIVNVRDLARFEAGSIIDEMALYDAGLVSGRIDGIKILADGDIGHGVTVKADKWSKAAYDKIVNAGGTIEAATLPVEAE